MKTWEDLTETQQQEAVTHEIDMFLKILCEGGLDFVDERLQAKLMTAVDEAEAMHTPWFLHEIIWEDEELKAAVTNIATGMAVVALYPEAGDYVSEANIKWEEA